LLAYLFRIFGYRVATLFGGICMLSVAVLSALYMVGGYSLASYVSDQLDRLPWDVSVLQSSGLSSHSKLREEYSMLQGVDRVESLGLMRLQRGNGVVGIEIDGKPFPARWIALIATTDTSILPKELQRGGEVVPTAMNNGAYQVQAALVTGSRAGAETVSVNSGSTIRIYPFRDTHEIMHEGGHFHGEPDPIVLDSDIPDTLLEAAVIMPPAQIERLEFNKWMLARVGSLSYLPEQSVVLAVPMEAFNKLVPLLDRLFEWTEGVHGGSAAPPYLPEMAHLLRLSRDEWVSVWDLDSSVKSLVPLLNVVHEKVYDVTHSSYVSSDLHRILSSMSQVSKLIGLVTLLVAIPLLWLAWVVAQMLSKLLLMNERRLIGLALIRGIPINSISQTLMLALIIGGVLGGLLGLVVGLGLPVLGHSLFGQPVPPWPVFMRGIVYFPVFIGLGLAVALFAGWGMIRQIRRMTPREAMARVSGNDVGESGEQLSMIYLVGSFLALVLGSYKVYVWIAGHSLLLSVLQGSLSEGQLQLVMLLESLLNFIAIPLFLAGIVGLLRWRLVWFQYLLNALAAPLVGKLRWFVAEHMALSRSRIASTLFLTALAMSLALLPQVGADTFYDRILRGVQVSLGSDVHLEFNLTDLAGGKDEPAPVPEYNTLVAGPLAEIEEVLRADTRVSDVTGMKQFVMPGVYLPAQSGLMLNLIDDPASYKQTVYYEEGLGLTRSFSEIVDRFSTDFLTTSQGFLTVRKVPMQLDIIFGYTGDYVPVTGQFNEVVAFLPGQPSVGVSQREGYATDEVNYLNYIMSSDARVFASTDRFDKEPLSLLKVIPSRAVFLVNTRSELNAEDIADLVAKLPVKPQNVRWQSAERQNVSKDMFISLALGNMKVFMVGGLILAIAGVFVVGLVNFIAERRTFSLLRLRGLPQSLLLRVSLAMFMIPVVVGIILGILLGLVSGYGISQAIWELPRIYGVAGFLENHLTFSLASWGIVLIFGVVLTLVAVGFGLWPFRNTAREAIRER